MFVPPINLGQFQPSPATLADWIYQIWNYLQNNPIATQEQLQEYIATFITTSPETQELIGEGVEQYLTDNPPQAPVQSVQGKTGAVTLAFNDILKNNNTAPVYRAASMPSQSTLQAQYNLGYRLFVNTSTQEIYSITNTGGTTLVGKGKFDGTDIDLDTEQGDTTIYESIQEIINNTTLTTADSPCFSIDSSHTSQLEITNQTFYKLAQKLVFFTLGIHITDTSILPVFDTNTNEFYSVEYSNYVHLDNMPALTTMLSSVGMAYLSIDPNNNRTVLILNRRQSWLTFTGFLVMP